MKAPLVISASANNFGSRGSVLPDSIVLHTTEGSLMGAAGWFKDPASRVSAHYIVGREGDLVACVPEGYCAWHAGNARVNRRSIGVECEGRSADPSTWTPELLAALVELCAEVCRRHQIPVIRSNGGPGICGHADVPNPLDPAKRGGLGGHTDPGPHFPWESFLDRLAVAVHPPVA